MIIYTKEKLITSVKFGHNGKGTLSVGTDRNFLILQELVKEKPIGPDHLKDEDIKEVPRVELEFFDPKSIDVMIRQLKRIKDNMENPLGQLALAC